jgi:hypothetical protein
MARPHLFQGRSPGECAFDRCILPFSFALLVTLVQAILFFTRGDREGKAPTEAELAAVAPDPTWSCIPFAIGIALAVYWLWAFRAVLRSWSDPVARILRFCSLVLLLGQLLGIVSLLSSPVVQLLNSRGSR